MCLYVNSEELTAKQDIIVWKIIDIFNASKFTGFKYAPNKLYRLRKKLKISDNVVIEEGFHSFQTCPTFVGWSSLSKIVEFTIPKGAKYYIGTHGDIVSSSIRSGSLVNLII